MMGIIQPKKIIAFGLIQNKKTRQTPLTRLLLIFICAFISINALALTKPTVIPEVTSHSKSTLGKKQEARVQTTHITRKEIAESPVVNLSELLRQEQSIVRITNNSTNTSQPVLSIRGFGDNAVANTLILVDGFPLTNPSLLPPNFNSIALSDIERVDILQGSEGSLWGGQAVGGVVNIITRHPEKQIIELTAGLGSFNKNYFSAFVGNKFHHGVFFKLYGFTDQTNHYRQHNRQTDNNIAAQAGMDYARGTIYLNVQTYHDSFQFPGPLTQAQFEANPRQGTNFKNVYYLDTHVYQLFNKHEINEHWILETRLSHHDIHGDGFTFFPFDSHEWMNSVRPRFIGSVRNNKIIFGYDGFNSRYHLINTKTEVSASAQQNNLYAQTIVPIFSQLDLTLGGRLAWQYNRALQISKQYVINTDRALVTEQGLSFHPNQEWQFFLRRDGNFRFPKATEAVWTPARTNVLQPQTGVSYEAGTIWTTARQTAQLSVYQLQLHNEIAFDPTQTPSQPFGSYQNFDHTRRVGVTVTESYHVTPKLLLDTQLNYVDARFASGPYSGNMIPAVPAVNGNVGLSYEFMPRWKTRLDTLYTGSRYASEDEANVGKKQPGYWLNSVAIQYMLKPVNVSFEVINVFNQRYSTYNLYNPVSKTVNYNPGAGRSYLLTAKLNLD